MKKAYILVYDDRLGSREQVKTCLNDLAEVLTWRFDLPHTFYFVSEAEALTIAELIRGRLGTGRFIIVEVTSNRGGVLSPETWYLFQNKTQKPPD
jgi:hypothetical protein